MRVSTAEVLDCLNQLDLASPWDEAVFHTVLKANFAKSRREQSEFERLYQLFFREMKKGLDFDLPKGDQSLVDEDLSMEKDQTLSAELIQHLKEAAAPEAGSVSDLDQALLDFLEGNPQALIEAVRQIHDQEVPTQVAVKSNLGQLTGRLEIMLVINKMKQKVVQFLGSHDAMIEDGEKGLADQVNQQLDKAMEFLNTDPKPDNAGLRQTGSGEKRYTNIGEIPFSNLTTHERDQVQEVIDQWVKKLEEISTLRFAAAKRGKVDVKKTIQRSAKYLGVPIELVRRDRPLRKGKIVTLCDVSGSVWSTARFMLNILYSLQSCFARVKSHVFIDSPIEVTGFFMAHDANTAIEKILNDSRINYNAKTDYGLAFQEYKARHFNDLDKKTTLIIMGDGRSNYLNPREPVLEELRERCRRLIWLNPEQERFWGTGDSEMRRYRNHCNEARPCGNLNQLIDFIQALVL